MKLNGRCVTSAAQLERELTKAAEKATETALRRAAGPGVRIKKTREGYLAEGSQDQIERLSRRLR